MFSYIALAWDARRSTGNASAQALTRDIRTHLPHLGSVFDAPGLRVFCSMSDRGPNEALPLADASGIVLGVIFERHTSELEVAPAARARFDEERTRTILATRGRHLIDACWGRYVALLRDPKAPVHWVLRDPTGQLTCYHSKLRDVSLFFSHLQDLERLPLPDWRIDGHALRLRVAASSMHVGSLLENVSDLHGGECLELRPGSETRQFYWRPRDIAAREPVEDIDRAVRALHATVKSTLHTWASVHPGIIVRASGGLDSSIVAGCLRDAPSRPRLTCFTLYTEQNRLHNLPFSRAVAAHLDAPSRELARNPRLDWTGLMRLPPLPAPVADPSCLEVAGPELALAREVGATAIFTGDGGDSLFGATPARLAAREYLRRYGLRWGLMRVAENVALYREITVWTVLRDAWRTRRVEPNEYEKAIRTRVLVDTELCDEFHALGEYAPHPWYATKPACPWSVILRLGTMSQLQPLYDVLHGSEPGSPEYVAPFYSQPIVELSLRIPAHLHILDGLDRALARRAFEHEVPRTILGRHWKDHPTGLFESMVLTNLPQARELLLDGVLVQRRLLDRARLDELLRPAAVRSGMCVGELFDHFACETWARRWAA